MLVKNTIEYHDQDVVLEGYYAYDDSYQGHRPLILVAHDWTGKTEFTQKKADQLAELGYIGFALDMFGKGKTGKNNEEKAALAKPFFEDRSFLKRRILTAYNTAMDLDHVDRLKTAAIGFCFGGTCVLDLARTGVDIRGIVSFHGGLAAPAHQEKTEIKAKILALHGYDDPMVPPQQVSDFEKEMTAGKVDWQMHIYGNTMHAFTNPLANDPGFGTVYSKCADKRSWIAMTNFFEEIFV